MQNRLDDVRGWLALVSREALVNLISEMSLSVGSRVDREDLEESFETAQGWLESGRSYWNRANLVLRWAWLEYQELAFWSSS